MINWKKSGVNLSSNVKDLVKEEVPREDRGDVNYGGEDEGPDGRKREKELSQPQGFHGNRVKTEAGEGDALEPKQKIVTVIV